MPGDGGTQVPLPSGAVWSQYPDVAVVVLCFALAAVSLFVFLKWSLSEYKKFRSDDLLWRKEQNWERDAAVAEQNRLWREAMSLRDSRYEQYDRERQGTLTQLVEAMAGLAEQISEHDVQAKEILFMTRRVDENTRPAPKAVERRKPQ